MIFAILSIHSSSIILIKEYNFQDNVGKNQCAGAIYFYSNFAVNLFSGAFRNNTSLHFAGGAIYFANNMIFNYITNTIFENNSAPLHSGGAIYAQDLDFWIDSCTFSNNSALVGGAIKMNSTNKY